MRALTPAATQLEQVTADNLYKLNRFYKRNGHRGKATTSHQSWWLIHNSDIVAALRLEPHPWGLLLRGMWVATELRGQGFGSQLLCALQPQLSKAPCYCLPYTTQLDFYYRNGFIDARDSAPTALYQQHTHYLARGESLGLLRHQPPCD